MGVGHGGSIAGYMVNEAQKRKVDTIFLAEEAEALWIRSW